MKHLVIVESPTKARTIGRYLGKDYEIRPSMGHVMDLPKSKLGVDVSDDFALEHEVLEDKKKIISELQKLAKEADSIILATDPDREGEAIASDVKNILSPGQKSKSKSQKFMRIVFHEITENAIKEAFEHPREVDENLVNAQIARRVLDRLVGYQLSPILWKKIRRGLSAGRVQSVALRLIVEREKEIGKFIKESYWTIHALFARGNDSTEFELLSIDNEKIEQSLAHVLYDGEYTITKSTIVSQEQADTLLSDIRKYIYIVTEVATRETKRSPYPPFTTSTLQQQAAQRFGYPGKRTMSLAQKLYEEGYITYHRTDSLTLSPEAIKQLRGYIEKTYGEKYLPTEPRLYFTKQKNAQEAHEAIRPTQIGRTPAIVSQDLGPQYGKLYELIWNRAIASQMPDALLESTTVYAESENKRYLFKTAGSVLIFDGFLRVTPQAFEDKRLPKFTTGERLDLREVRADAHETTPPPRYNDASLIKTLEEKGIGRPSTYASIISTLTDRTYIDREEKKFVPTSVGVAVNDFLVANFSTIDDVPFTASMEDNLDLVANGEKEWREMMKEFYKPFSQRLKEVENVDRVQIPVEETGEVCPECKQGQLVIRTGKFGKFFSCNQFPDCRFTKPFVEETNVLCPKDGGKVIIKKTKKGRKFYGCSNYPNCEFAAWKLEDIQKAKGVGHMPTR